MAVAACAFADHEFVKVATRVIKKSWRALEPHALVEHRPESLEPDEFCRGRPHKKGENGFSQKSFDIFAALADVLGKRASEVPDFYDRGELLVDTAMDLETNATKGFSRENSLLLRRGSVPDDAVIKIAQTFRSGTNDIDAIDCVDMFLATSGRRASTRSTTCATRRRPRSSTRKGLPQIRVNNTRRVAA